MRQEAVVPSQEKRGMVRYLQNRPYWQLILGSGFLSFLTATDVAIPDCVPYLDEAGLAMLSSAFVVALVRKIIADLRAR